MRVLSVLLGAVLVAGCTTNRDLPGPPTGGDSVYIPPPVVITRPADVAELPPDACVSCGEGVVVNAFDAHARIGGEALLGTAGASVANVGDLSDDGVDDFAIGAPFAEASVAGQSTGGAGAVYLFYGVLRGELTVADADVTIVHEQGGDLGRAIAGGGDLNNDGHDDLVLGAPLSYDGLWGPTEAGVAHVFFGPLPAGTTLTAANADLHLIGTEPLGGAAAQVAIVGDIDNDGIDDLAVGLGGAYPTTAIFFGPLPVGTRYLTNADLTVTSPFGHAVPSRDVGGGPANDLLLTDPPNGAVLFFGPVTAGVLSSDQANVWTASGAPAHGEIGDSVAVLASLQGDAPTLLLTEPGWGVHLVRGPLEAGRVDLDRQATTLLGDPGIGAALAAGGDVDGDGRADFAVSQVDPASFEAATCSLRSRVYVLADRAYGSGADLALEADRIIEGGRPCDGFGVAMDVGDFDGDGLADLVVGAPFAGELAQYAGAAYVFYGAP